MFNCKNAVSISYLSLVGVIIFSCLCFFGLARLGDILELLFFGPYQFDYTRLCCVHPSSNIVIKSVFIALTAIGLICFFVSGYALKKWLRVFANACGIMSIVLWHSLLLLFLLISGLEH